MDVKNFFLISDNKSSSSKTNNASNTNGAPHDLPPNAGGNNQREIIKPSVVLFEWQAPERPFKKKSREFYRRLAVIIIFFAILFLIIKDFILIGALAAFFFVTYVYTTIPPRKVKHQITTNGVNYASEQKFMWKELESFFFQKKDGVDFLIFNTYDKFPGRLYLILSDDIDKKKLQETINQYISIVEDPEESYLDRASSFLGNKFKLG